VISLSGELQAFRGLREAADRTFDSYVLTRLAQASTSTSGYERKKGLSNERTDGVRRTVSPVRVGGGGVVRVTVEIHAETEAANRAVSERRSFREEKSQGSAGAAFICRPLPRTATTCT